MRCVTAVIGAMAMLVLSVGAAHAQFEFGMNYFQFTNWDNSGTGPAWQDGGWTATTEGAIWMKNGSTYELNWHDVNFRLDYRHTPTDPWTTITGAYLLSNGVAAGDVNIISLIQGVPATPAGAYPGYWLGADGATGWNNNSPDVTSPYRMAGNGCGIYYLPGTGATTEYPDGQPTQAGMQFNLYAWTGNYSSFFDAAGAGEHVAMTGPFQVGQTAYWIMPIPQSTFSNMPSMLLQTTLPGDANLDGTVNINDLSKVLTNYDKAGMIWSDGDFDGNGTVNINDLSKVLTNYDRTVAAGAAISAVPEPSTLLLIAVAGLLGHLSYVRKGK
jgi:hypothetical protein